jgi:putative transposase
MARSLRIQYPGAFYHVMCRGNARRKIFLDDDDRYRFLKLLHESMETYQVLLYAYVMMDSHFHLVVQTVRANLSEFMRRFNICYTGWFHYHHGTCGHLYQGRYKSYLVDADNYLLELSRYVHLNPIRGNRFKDSNHRGQLSYLRKYRWSSLPGYLDARKVNDLVTYDMILQIVGGRRDYGLFLADGIRYGVRDLSEDVQHQAILGDQNFLALVKSKYIEEGSLRDQPSYRGMRAEMLSPKVVLACVSSVCGLPVKNLLRRGGDGICRGLLVEMLYRYCGLTLAAIGRFIGGIDYGGVHQLRRRLKGHMSNNELVRKKFHAIEISLRKLCSK